MREEVFDFVCECVVDIISKNNSIHYIVRQQRIKQIKELKNLKDFFGLFQYLINGSSRAIKNYINKLSLKKIEEYIEMTYFSNIEKSEKFKKIKTLLKLIEKQTDVKKISKYIEC